MKNKKGSIATIVVIVLLSLGLISTSGYIVYDKVLSNNNKKEEVKQDENKDTSVVQEELVKGNKFDLSKIKCDAEETCTKKLKVSYNGKNHEVSLTRNKGIDNELSRTEFKYTVLIDGKEVKTDIYGGFVDEIVSNKSEDKNFDFDGYVYIFDDKYLGIMPKTSWPTGYSLILFNGENYINRYVILQGGQSLHDKNGIELNTLENVKFDGSSLEYYKTKCNSDVTEIEKVKLHFNIDIPVIDVIETIEGSVAGASC